METELSINGLVEGNFDDITANNITVENDLTVIGDTINSGNQLITGTLGVSGSIDTNIGYLLNGLPLSTTDITEGSNLYYTDARSRLAITASSGITYDSSNGAISISATTDLIPQGLSNLYYSDSLARAAITAGSGITYDSSNGTISLSANTSIVPEGSNLYYTDTRSRAAITGSTNIPFNKTTGEIGLDIKGTVPITTPDLGKWFKANYGGASDYGMGQWSYGRTRLFTPDNYGSCGFATVDFTGNVVDTFRVDYNKVGYLSGSMEISGDCNLAPSGLYKIGGTVLNTDHIYETPSAQYFTNAKARAAISVDTNTGLTYNVSTGLLANTKIALSGTTTRVLGNASSLELTDGDTFLKFTGECNLNVRSTATGGNTSRLRLQDGNGYGYSLTNQATDQALNIFSFYPTGVAKIVASINTTGNLSALASVSAPKVVVSGNIELNYNNSRSTISTTGGTQLFTINNNGEAHIGTGAPSAGYGLYMEKPAYIKKNTGDCILLEGTDTFNGNPVSINFKSGATQGYIQHVDSGGGQFYTSKPLTVNGKLWAYGNLEVDNNALIDGAISVSGVATFYGKSYHVGGLKSNTGLELVPGDPGKMVYKAYNSTNDVYGVGQYAGGRMRMFCGSYNNSWGWKSSMGVCVSESSGQFIDQLSVNNGKIAMVGYQGFTGPNDVINNLSPYIKTEALNSTSQYDSTLRIDSFISQNLNTSLRTFETIATNLGISANNGNAILENQWFQSCNYLGSFGTNFVEFFQTKMATLCYPVNNGITGNAYMSSVPQFYISTWRSGVGEKVHVRYTYNNAYIAGNGGFNQSNVCFPQCARGAYYNAYFDPYGFVYPDVYASDKRLKTNIEPTGNILEEYKKIQVVNFDWDNKGDHADYFSQQPRGIGVRQVGIIAQDLEALPTIQEKFKIVKTMQFSNDLPSGNNATPWDKSKSNFKPEKEFLILEKERLPFLNMKAIQEVAAQVESLGAVDLGALQKENEALKTKVIELEQTLEGLILVLKRKFVI